VDRQNPSKPLPNKQLRECMLRLMHLMHTSNQVQIGVNGLVQTLHHRDAHYLARNANTSSKSGSYPLRVSTPRVGTGKSGGRYSGCKGPIG
jgi:hypothetical protein